nr:15405_t:CDS:1 [Entrophospora candida]CAG8608260.1 7743_t:CDS:1 [Entrophospora candida]
MVLSNNTKQNSSEVYNNDTVTYNQDNIVVNNDADVDAMGTENHSTSNESTATEAVIPQTNAIPNVTEITIVCQQQDIVHEVYINPVWMINGVRMELSINTNTPSCEENQLVDYNLPVNF